MKKIYFIPGLMCDNNLWNDLFDILSNEYELITLDIPQEDSLETMVESLNRSITDEEINLVGFSLGAYLASSLSIKYPKKVKKLFLIGASLCSLKENDISKKEVALELVEKYGFKGLSKKKIKQLLLKENQNNDRLIKLIEDMYTNLGEDVFKIQVKATLKRDDLFIKLSSLEIKTTFYYSLEDKLINIQWLERLEDIDKSIYFIKTEGSSHMLPLEKVKELSVFIKNWLK